MWSKTTNNFILIKYILIKSLIIPRVGKVVEYGTLFTANEGIYWFREKMMTFNKVESMYIHNPKSIPRYTSYRNFHTCLGEMCKNVHYNNVTMKYQKQPGPLTR